MRFLQSAVAALALIGLVDARVYQFDVTGDNTFQVYVSKPGQADIATILSADINQDSPDGQGVPIQQGWNTPSRYSNLELETGDVLSVYVQNEAAAANPGGGLQAQGNPSAIVGRLRELTGINGAIKAGGDDIPTDQKWDCAYRIETASSDRGFNPNRLSGNPKDWASADLPTGTTFNLLSNQLGSTGFSAATQISKLSDNNIWANTGIVGPFGTTAIVTGIPLELGLSTPYWIYGTNQQRTDALVHHGWCRYKIPARGGAPTSPGGPGAGGDPVFNGFQGQEFQFHGLPDEHFNLISSPQVQLNAHFVYLSSGKCDYNNTQCWTHPGTYMDVMGFSIGEARIKLVAGTHANGLRVWVNDAEVPRHTTIASLSGNVTASLHYSRSGHVKIATDLIDYEIVNSDMFMNLQAALKSSELLKVGSHKHTVTDSSICHSNAETHNHQLIESTVSKKYPITTPLHGLVGQTWRNVKVCSRDWMGTVQDYVTESLFGTTYHYNYFQF